MLERFNKLRLAIQKALMDMKSDIQFSNDEFILLTETISVLMPIKYAVKALCHQDANLLTADAALKFLLNTLAEIDGDLATYIKDALELRFKERRNHLSGLLQYLHNGKVNNTSDSTDVFAPLKKGLAKNLLLATVKRLFSSINDENQQDIINKADVEDQEVVEVEQEAESIKDQMQKAIENEISMSEKEKKTLFSTTSTIERTLRREQAQFEDDRTRGKYFTLCYNALKSIPPTSVESERVFSVSGNLCTKLRSRLGDKILDDLCFLRAYFNKLEQ